MRVPAATRGPLAALARRMTPAGKWVHVVVGDDALLRGLNQRFRGLDRPTDVLSFDYGAGAHSPETPEAEVYVSLPRTRVQARTRGHSVASEFVLLVLHGLLHLQGHDHHGAAEARRMRRAEAVLLQRLRDRWPRLGPATTMLPDPERKSLR